VPRDIPQGQRAEGRGDLRPYKTIKPRSDRGDGAREFSGAESSCTKYLGGV